MPTTAQANAASSMSLTMIASADGIYRSGDVLPLVAVIVSIGARQDAGQAQEGALLPGLGNAHEGVRKRAPVARWIRWPDGAIQPLEEESSFHIERQRNLVQCPHGNPVGA